MVDKFPKEIRSKIMSRIKGKNTRPEILLRKSLFNLGYRYSLKYRFKEQNFIPDIVMVSRKTCIFVDGCFWHKCPKCYKEPLSNRKYWVPKMIRNSNRDKMQGRYLKKNGWKVIRIWEHQINDNLDETVEMVVKRIKKKM